MKYICTNKICDFECLVRSAAPLQCPRCGADMEWYRRPEEQGRDYEQHIVKVTNEVLNLAKDKGVYMTPGSGCYKNFKGDITRFPKPVDDLLAQCKDTVPTKDEEEQWKQSVKDAIKMRQTPCLIKPFFGRDTIRLDYQWFLKLIKEVLK